MVFTSYSAFSEYRAYQFIVKNKISIKDAPNGHLVTTTLDPVTYIAYNGGESIISADLLRTWICPGHTGYRQDICESPYGKVPAGVLE